MDMETIRKKRKALEAHCHEIEMKKLQGAPALKGHIKCNRCHSVMVGDICLTAGCTSARCYLDIYWKGKKYRFFKYSDDKVFDYQRALETLKDMNTALKNKTFNPLSWTGGAYQERKTKQQAEKWLSYVEKAMRTGTRAYETYRTYKSHLENHIIPFFGEWDVREIRYEQLEDFVVWLGGRVSINTSKRIVGTLHTFFKWLYRRGTIQILPPFPRVEGEEVVRRALNFKAQLEILKALPDEHGDIIEFGMWTGLRPNELCALQVQDIDMINATALIQRGYSGKVYHEKTKGKNKRQIPLSARALEIVKKNIRGKLQQSFVFTNPNTGRGYTLKALDNMWAKYMGREIKKNEAMRHSFITQIAEQGASDSQLMALSRHKDKRSLQAYTHINTSSLRELVEGRGKIVPIASPLPEPKEVN